jgi:hypothetical protein
VSHATWHTLPENRSDEHRQRLLGIRGDREVVDQLTGVQNIGNRSAGVAENEPPVLPVHAAMQRDQLSQHGARDVLHRFEVQHELPALVMIDQGL